MGDSLQKFPENYICQYIWVDIRLHQTEMEDVVISCSVFCDTGTSCSVFCDTGTSCSVFCDTGTSCSVFCDIEISCPVFYDTETTTHGLIEPLTCWF